MISCIKRFLKKAIRPLIQTAILALPTLVFAILTLTRPAQYDVVIALAAADGFQIYLAVAIAFIAAILSLWMIWITDRFAIWYTFVPMLLPITLALSVWQVAGVVEIPVVIALAVVVASGAGFTAFLLIGDPERAPLIIRTIWVPYGLACFGLLALGFATIQSPIWLPRTLGSTAIVVAFITVVGLSILVGSLRPRIAGCTLLYVFLATLLFPPNKHDIPIASSEGSKTRVLEATLREWLQNRRDIEPYRKMNLPYPVIFVSSEGGGIYAAAHAYSTLSTISAKCPTFAQHVFALVGVSGGAIGNALFANEVDPTQRDSQPCGPNGREIEYNTISADHLSPVLARLLLVEAFDRFIPGQWSVSDRAQVLSDSFVASVGNTAFLNLPVMQSFDTETARPAVVSVTTNVLDGRRFVISPFAPEIYSGTAEWWPAKSVLRLDRPDPSQDIKIMDGAAVSARFPWITPTGRLTTAPEEQVLLADGGYFENSGADTVVDLINDIRFSVGIHNYIGSDDEDAGSATQTTCDEQTINIVRNFHDHTKPWAKCETRVFLIHFAIASTEPEAGDVEGKTGDAQMDEQQNAADVKGGTVKTVREMTATTDTTNKSASQHFLLDPLRALLATRTSRAEIALSRADLEQCGLAIPGAECYANPGSSMGFFRNNIVPTEWKLPLGWYMPRALINELRSKSIDDAIFDYHAKKEVVEDDIGLIVFHLDPGLYANDADPGFNDVMPGP